MAISETWTDPDSLDRATGEVLTEAIWDGTISNEAWIAGQTSTGHIQSIRLGIPVDNSTGGTLTAGTLVYVSGYDASSGAPQVTKADGDSRLAEYVLQADISDGTTGYAFRGYTLGSLDTSASSVGDPIYLSATAGGWTATALTGSAQLSQRVGVVVTSHASTGSVLFDLPGELLKIGSGQLQSGAVASGGKIQAVATLGAKTGAQTSTSDTYIDISSMSATLTTTKGGLLVWASCSADCDAANEEGYLALQLDSDGEVGIVSAVLGAGSSNQNAVLSTVYAWTSVSDASHTVDARFRKAGHTAGTWKVDTGTLLMMEFDD